MILWHHTQTNRPNNGFIGGVGRFFPDLGRSVFYLFGPIKWYFIRAAVCEWLYCSGDTLVTGARQDFFGEIFSTLVFYWCTSPKRGDDCIEKCYTSSVCGSSCIFVVISAVFAVMFMLLLEIPHVLTHPKYGKLVKNFYSPVRLLKSQLFGHSQGLRTVVRFFLFHQHM